MWGRQIKFNHSNMSEGTRHICGSKFVIDCVCVFVCREEGGGAYVICQYYCINGHVSMDTHVKCSIRCTSYMAERRPSKT